MRAEAGPNATRSPCRLLAGDRITIAGDYGDNLPGKEENLYYIAQREYEDISAPMRELIRCDKWLRDKFVDQFKWAESLKEKESA